MKVRVEMVKSEPRFVSGCAKVSRFLGDKVGMIQGWGMGDRSFSGGGRAGDGGWLRFCIFYG